MHSHVNAGKRRGCFAVLPVNGTLGCYSAITYCVDFIVLSQDAQESAPTISFLRKRSLSELSYSFLKEGMGQLLCAVLR